MNRWFTFAPVLMLPILLACSGETKPSTPKGTADMTFALHSDAFKPNSPIPTKYSGEGENISPPLRWSDLPADTKELAMIVDDPDAPTPEPWVHWVIYKIPPSLTGLPEGVSKTVMPPEVPGGLQGANTSGKPGYTGPMPPPGHGLHHYHFKLYALDTALALEAGVDKKSLLKEIQGHLLGTAELVGTYER